jgi:hypothetical protein
MRLRFLHNLELTRLEHSCPHIEKRLNLDLVAKQFHNIPSQCRHAGPCRMQHPECRIKPQSGYGSRALGGDNSAAVVQNRVAGRQGKPVRKLRAGFAKASCFPASRTPRKTFPAFRRFALPLQLNAAPAAPIDGPGACLGYDAIPGIVRARARSRSASLRSAGASLSVSILVRTMARAASNRRAGSR